MINKTTSSNIINSLKPSQVDHNSQGELNDETLGTLIRRIAGITCPISRTHLKHHMVLSLLRLAGDKPSLEKRVDAAIEALLVCGDIIQLSSRDTYEPDDGEGFIYTAPPSFLQRDSGRILIIGVGFDDATFLPDSHLNRISFKNFSRFIDPVSDEDLPKILLELGLRQINRQTWVTAPIAETSGKHLQCFKDILVRDGGSADIPELCIYSPDNSCTTYHQGWMPLGKQTGLYIARRPQAYGSAIWCFIEVVQGKVNGIVDFPIKGSRLRGCDTAWRLQHAIDANINQALNYYLEKFEDKIQLNFKIPIPLWAQQRLVLMGQLVPPSRGNVLAFQIPASESATEEKFLQEHLWLTPKK